MIFINNGLIILDKWTEVDHLLLYEHVERLIANGFVRHSELLLKQRVSTGAQEWVASEQVSNLKNILFANDLGRSLLGDHYILLFRRIGPKYFCYTFYFDFDAGEPSSVSKALGHWTQPSRF